MLGLRHFEHTAIDIFQGQISDFVCDTLVLFVSTRAPEGSTELLAGVGDKLSPNMKAALEAFASGAAPQSLQSVKAGDLPAQSILLAQLPGCDENSVEFQTELRKLMLAALEAALPRRHLALNLKNLNNKCLLLEILAECSLITTRDFLLEKKSPKSLKRITFVLDSRDEYSAFQQALFKIFPETERD